MGQYILHKEGLYPEVDPSGIYFNLECNPNTLVAFDPVNKLIGQFVDLSYAEEYYNDSEGLEEEHYPAESFANTNHQAWKRLNKMTGGLYSIYRDARLAAEKAAAENKSKSDGGEDGSGNGDDDDSSYHQEQAGGQNSKNVETPTRRSEKEGNETK